MTRRNFMIVVMVRAEPNSSRPAIYSLIRIKKCIKRVPASILKHLGNLF